MNFILFYFILFGFFILFIIVDVEANQLTQLGCTKKRKPQNDEVCSLKKYSRKGELCIFDTSTSYLTVRLVLPKKKTFSKVVDLHIHKETGSIEDALINYSPLNSEESRKWSIILNPYNTSLIGKTEDTVSDESRKKLLYPESEEDYRVVESEKSIDQYRALLDEAEGAIHAIGAEDCPFIDNHKKNYTNLEGFQRDVQIDFFSACDSNNPDPCNWGGLPTLDELEKLQEGGEVTKLNSELLRELGGGFSITTFNLVWLLGMKLS
ncbi:MAG: hypothetical protein HOE90_01540 [Bacteriovoracaceae bacterium]|jgi:hypothetical protein|nr:hypothetical protein [Bacteriovoracaceae bacterium]